MYQGKVPDFEEFIVGANDRLPRVGVYAPVYARLHELRLAYDKAVADNPDTPQELRGLRVTLPSVSGGHAAVKRMNIWANEDGFNIMMGPPVEGRRELHLVPLEEVEA